MINDLSDNFDENGDFIYVDSDRYKIRNILGIFGDLHYPILDLDLYPYKDMPLSGFTLELFQHQVGQHLNKNRIEGRSILTEKLPGGVLSAIIDRGI